MSAFVGGAWWALSSVVLSKPNSHVEHSRQVSQKLSVDTLKCASRLLVALFQNLAQCHMILGEMQYISTFIFMYVYFTYNVSLTNLILSQPYIWRFQYVIVRVYRSTDGQHVLSATILNACALSSWSCNSSFENVSSSAAGDNELQLCGWLGRCAKLLAQFFLLRHSESLQWHYFSGICPKCWPTNDGTKHQQQSNTNRKVGKNAHLCKITNFTTRAYKRMHLG